MTAPSKNLLCPYCGHPQPPGPRCVECGGLFDLLSRKATQAAMGPWFIRDRQRPHGPGCSYPVLLKLIEQGRVHAHTVLRGPTTHQFWSVARNVPGVAHLLGYCHECNKPANPTDAACVRCRAVFVKPLHRNELGLLYPTQEAALAVQAELERETQSDRPIASTSAGPPASPASNPTLAADLALAGKAPLPPAGPPVIPQVVAPAVAPAASSSIASSAVVPPGESGMLWTQAPAVPAVESASSDGASDGLPGLPGVSDATADLPTSRRPRRWVVPVLVGSNAFIVLLLLWALWQLAS